MRAFMNGTLTVDDLDDEEIMRGQLRNAKGDFSGGQAEMIPRAFAMAVMHKQKLLIFMELAGMVTTALKALDEVLNRKNPQPGDSAKVAAAKLVLEYNIGKVPDKVEIKGEIDVWEKRMSDAAKPQAVTIDWGEFLPDSAVQKALTTGDKPKTDARKPPPKKGAPRMTTKAKVAK